METAKDFLEVINVEVIDYKTLIVEFSDGEKNQ